MEIIVFIGARSAMIKNIFLSTIVALGVPLSASATTFDFDAATNGTFEEFVLVEDGITLTVTAGSYAFDNTGVLGSFNADVDGGGLGVGDLAVRNIDGLGVVLAGAPNLFPSTNGPIDLLTFNFSEAVNFESASFGNVDGDDDFDFFVDGVIQSPADRNIAAANPAPLTGFGTQFSIGADDLFFGFDNFTVSEISVSAVAPVPLPAAGWMLLAGVGGIAAMRRRKKT